MRERGVGSLDWLVGITLVLVPAAAVVLSLAPWFERTTALTAAVQEAARAVALAEDDVSAAIAVAEIEDRLEHAYWAADCVRLTVTPGVPSAFRRGEWIVSRGEMAMPGVVVPFLGSVGSLHHTAVHREAVDPYRSLPR